MNHTNRCEKKRRKNKFCTYAPQTYDVEEEIHLPDKHMIYRLSIFPSEFGFVLVGVFLLQAFVSFDFLFLSFLVVKWAQFRKTMGLIRFSQPFFCTFFFSFVCGSIQSRFEHYIYTTAFLIFSFVNYSYYYYMYLDERKKTLKVFQQFCSYICRCSVPINHINHHRGTLPVTWEEIPNSSTR